MKAVLPGKPESRLQGLASGYWDSKNINIYITGNAISILKGATYLIQTIYDEDEATLEAVAFDERAGNIAVCTGRDVRLYKPAGLTQNGPRWTLHASFAAPSHSSNSPCCLSFGSSGDLLVASTELILYSTRGGIVRLWHKRLACPVKIATLCYDSAYIASISMVDMTPKVWRRLAYGQDQVRFSVTYLQHPEPVTSLRWKKPFHLDQAIENVLYTFCLDGKIRIWTPTESIEGHHWQMWGLIDAMPSSQPGCGPRDALVAFIVDQRDFTASVERAVQTRMADDNSTDDIALDHLVAVANRNPEICITFDGEGAMSAWALEDVRGSTALSEQIFSIAHISSRQVKTLAGFLSARSARSTNIQVESYCDVTNGRLHLLIHCFDGRIGVIATSVADLFDPVTNERRLDLVTIWTGHANPITKVARNFSGSSILSRTDSKECTVWRHGPDEKAGLASGLTRQSLVPVTEHVETLCVLETGQYVVLMMNHSISLWDCRTATAGLVAEVRHELGNGVLCLMILPRAPGGATSTTHIASATSFGTGIVWEIRLPTDSGDVDVLSTNRLQEFCRFDMDTSRLTYVLPVDPAGLAPVTTGFLDVFARDVAVSYDHSGEVNMWTVRVDIESQTVEWLSTCSTNVNISDAALLGGSMLKKVAVVDASRSQITIWDIGSSRLEYQADHGPDHRVHDLDWTSTPDAQSILAVGFLDRVVLLSQMRFDYLNDGPAWVPLREISISNLTPHPIGDSAWLAGGHLAIGAGHQIFVFDRHANNSAVVEPDLMLLPTGRKQIRDLFEVVQRLNGPLPVFHPQFLSQCILAGKASLTSKILKRLGAIMEYYVDGDTLDDYLDIDLAAFYTTIQPQGTKRLRRRGSYMAAMDSVENDLFGETMAAAINEKLLKVSLPRLSSHDQMQLADIIECAGFVERHRRSMDENGARFMLFFRQSALQKGRARRTGLSWREVNWAFHSESQDILVDFVAQHNHGHMLWAHARDSGIFMWLTNLSKLKVHFELVARTEYTKDEDRNPVKCSLYYLALRKKTVLLGLWRMAGWNKEQKATLRLLSNNFEEARHKTTALKNAYALLSKHRFEYAAAFFLLAGHLEDAVEVCLSQLKDLQLAVAITRVYEGDSGPIMSKLLQETILPLAAREGNRWLASWAFWMLGRKDMAVRALVTPVYETVETPGALHHASRLYLATDPALVIFYEQLRQKTLQTLRGASKVTPKMEWAFVLQCAKLYDRMGCDLLALDLLRNWEFQQHSQGGLGGGANPLKLLSRRNTLTIDDSSKATLLDPSIADMLAESATGHGREKTSHSTDQTKEAPTMFVEPDVGSLLDNFGL